MVPQPSGHNPQTPRLTATLRKICRDYPAGAGVLRELLQNADDAGASFVEFVFDGREHPKTPLLDDDNGTSKTFTLSEFQGPALLVHNDAKFSERDWASLAAIGDSKKAREKNSTGKFGLGFNSVYNWTDSPSILSGDTLLLLDPHHSWSSQFPHPGGPCYNFPKGADEEAMINQLAGFKSILKDPKQPFEGTIIRLPLRTSSTAPKSEIKPSEVTTENDIRCSLKSLIEEMRGSGLLFLKSVRRLRIAIHGGPETSIVLKDSEEPQSVSNTLKNLVAGNGPFETDKSVQLYREVSIEHITDNKVTSKRYGICHLFGFDDLSDDLSSWASSEKLLPWVAVATNLDVEQDDNHNDNHNDGKLFTVLPLPITTGLSTNLHGMFSISTDRAKLLGFENSGVQDERPGDWNRLLFDRMLPLAWIMLFTHISRIHADFRLDFWEMTTPSDMTFWSNINHNLVRFALHLNSPIWSTPLGFTCGDNALFAPLDTDPTLVQATQSIKVPLVLLPFHILRLVGNENGVRKLSSKSLLEALPGASVFPKISIAAATKLVNYLFDDNDLSALYTLPIFPFKDGSVRSILPGQNYLSRNEFESTLIPGHDRDTIDDNLLSEKVLKAMRSNIKQYQNTWLQYRGLKTLETSLTNNIKSCAQAGNTKSLYETLKYLQEHFDLTECRDFLANLQFVVLATGIFTEPHQAVKSGADKLQPYLGNVDSRFYSKFEKLVNACNIPEKPTLEQLQALLRDLSSRSLSNQDVDILVEVAQIWATEQYPVDQLKLPDTKKILVNISELILCDEFHPGLETRPFLHSKFSGDLAGRLGIEPLSELVRKGELGITDEEDEFEQAEDTIDGIRDTLDRYPIDSTFSEYLANADDCGMATEVNFMFDGNAYPANKLISPELAKFQGPALLIHNDGVFTDKDLEGFKHVGRGSKRDDPTTIGKFGRGSQTMFHWTDVPMILSGEYLLILDPLKKHLPYNYYKHRQRPGMKIPLKSLQWNDSDQLAPFEGLWGFEKSIERYAGTIFRFPLRSEEDISGLLESRQPLDSESAKKICDAYFDQARLSLLFLRKIQRIDYTIKPPRLWMMSNQLRWRISRGKWPNQHSLSNWAEIKAQKIEPEGQNSAFTDKYWRMVRNIDDIPSELVQHRKGRMKTVECGIAALVDQSGSKFKEPQFTFFNALPLRFQTHLPAHFHATFLLTGDRQTIVTEESATDSGTKTDAGAKMNKYLLQTALPDLYFEFLGSLAHQLGEDVYKHFPINPRSSSSGVTELSNLIFESFMEQLNSTEHRIFPLTTAWNSQLKTKTPRPRTQRPETPRSTLRSPAQALFDFLDPPDSKALRSLLLACKQPIVHPTLPVQKALKRNSQLNAVTPDLVRKLLRTRSSQGQILDIRKKKPDFFARILKYVEPKDESDLELQGCKILPLADGSLGTLTLKVPDDVEAGGETYFNAPLEVHKLFAFSSHRLVELSKESFARLILNTELYNVVDFEKEHIAILLEDNENWNLDKTSRKWIKQVWKYINDCSSAGENSLIMTSLRSFPLIITKCQGEHDSLISFDDFESGPCMVEPVEAVHKSLLEQIPGLKLAAFNTLPANHSNIEENLERWSSMERLMRSIEKLALTDECSITEFVRESIEAEDLKTLHGILLRLWNRNGRKLPYKCRELPVCQCRDPEAPFISLAEALSVKNARYLVPWMKNFAIFVQDNDMLEESQIISASTVLEHYILPYLPGKIESHWKEHYTSLILAIDTDDSLRWYSKKRRNWGFVLPLWNHRLAAGNDGVMRRSSAYFDHTDSLFECAFRNGEQQYLIMEACQSRSLWHKLGLRRRNNGEIEGSDYIVCLEQLQKLITADETPVNDVRAILAPLCSPNIQITNITGHREAIGQLAQFPVERQPGQILKYRAAQMAAIFSRQRYIPMHEVQRKEFLRVLWSQSAFVSPEPSVAALREVINRSEPECWRVCKHLEYLSGIRECITNDEIDDYVQDLRKTYEYLEARIPSSVFAILPQSSVWFNPESAASITRENLKENWSNIENLILDSPCDSPPLNYVRPWLAKFSPLLKAAGCQVLHYPSVCVPKEGESRSLSGILREFQAERVLTDVEVVAGSKTISAHKNILAARSEYCKAKFHGPGANFGASSLLIEEHTISMDVVEVMIDFCYDNHHDWLRSTQVNGNESLEELADKLDGLLKVVEGADFWMIQELHHLAQQQILMANKYLIRPDNVEQVKKIAEETNAKDVAKYCQEYMDGNKVAVELANQDSETEGVE